MLYLALSISHFPACQVSCGGYHSAVVTVIKRTGGDAQKGDDEILTGGKVYVAGTAQALGLALFSLASLRPVSFFPFTGVFTPAFTEVAALSKQEKVRIATSVLSVPY